MTDIGIERLRLLVSLVAVMEHRHTVWDVIATSETLTDARARLQTLTLTLSGEPRLGTFAGQDVVLDERQARAVLDLRLGRMTHSEYGLILDDIQQLQATDP